MDHALVNKVLAKIGYTLLNVQSTERVVKRVIQIAMPHEKYFSLPFTERFASKESDRPLGAFLTELRKRASLHAEMDELLRRFLERRNAFIHDIANVEGWTLKSVAGLRVINTQLDSLLTDSADVRTHFLALLYSWRIQGEMEATQEEEDAFRAIAGKYEDGVLSRKWGTDAQC